MTDEISSTSLFEVLAHWGYSEILGAIQAEKYGGPAIDALREKRREGVDFAELTLQERYALASQCALVRSPLLPYFVGIERFDLATITRFQLGHLSVPPNVSQQSNGVLCPFSFYINTPTNEVGDARFVTAPPQAYVAPDDPLTIGYINGLYVLIDGYHRAATFWRFGIQAGTETLSTYRPRVPAGLAQVGRPF
jgi:hypothetical protein